MTGGSDPGEGEHVVDARGKRCPLPVIDLARHAAEHPTAGRVLVLATDPAAAHDIPAWCRMRGHRFVEERLSGDHSVYVVELIEQNEQNEQVEQ